jgi:hypothetical protein
LLIGFNRPNLLRARLEELEHFRDKKVSIYISIDGPRPDNSDDILQISNIRKFLNDCEMKDSFTAWFSSKNSGCDIHIYDSINKVLVTNDIVAVIEDDIAASSNAITELLSQAERQFSKGSISPLVMMSGISRKIIFTKNRWRKSKYFSAWGYALNRNFWAIHTECMKISDPGKIDSTLLESYQWQKMSKRKKVIWRERTSRANYDYAIQRTMIMEKLSSLAPIYRISDNVGHGVPGAAHTRFRTPWFLRYPALGKNDHFHSNNLSTGALEGLLMWIDSQTWAGDGLLSVRGRTRGIRTVLKEIFVR